MIDSVGLNINKQVKMMSNLSFDHPITNNELIDLQNLLSTPISISQIYFKDNIDIESIEKVKLLLEGFPNVNDAVIEKYIMKDMNEEEKELLLNLNFFNIETWNIAYSKTNNKYFMTSFVKYKKMEEWFKEILLELDNNSFSVLDKVCYLYDKVKMLEFDSDLKYDRLPEIISDGKSSPYGYNYIFKELLSKIGIKSIIGKINNSEEENYITLAIINDDKYKVKGIYGFDPSMDTIYKDQYKNNLARKMNYNFFAININKLKKAYSKRNMQGILKLLASDDMMEFNHFNDLYYSKKNGDEISQVESDICMPIKDMYNEVINTRELSNDTIISIMTKTLERYPSDILDKNLLTKAISDNYSTRNNEIFTNKRVKKMSMIDTNC